MSRHREIPGMYFDEVKGRYFAIPSSGKVPHSNSSAIQKLNDDIQKVKRQKLPPPPVILVTNEIQWVKNKLISEYNTLRELEEYVSRFGVTNHVIESKITNLSPKISPHRPFQMIKLYFEYISPRILDVGGFCILTKCENHMDYQIGIYNTNCETIQFVSSTTLELNADIGRIFEHPEQFSLDSFEKNDDQLDISGRNGEVVRLKKEGKVSNKTIYVFNNNIIINRTKHKTYMVQILDNEGLRKSHIELDTTSEIVSADLLDGCLVYGCRNGQVGIYDLNDPTRFFKMDFGGTICSVLLVGCNGAKYCVVSGQNNTLRSYYLNMVSFCLNLDRIYDGYKWSLRVSNNMKSDPQCDGIFGVESECDDSNKLSILFFSVTCTKPLIMKNGPFQVLNINTSQYLWGLYLRNLILFNHKIQKFCLYRNPLYRDTDDLFDY